MKHVTSITISTSITKPTKDLWHMSLNMVIYLKPNTYMLQKCKFNLGTYEGLRIWHKYLGCENGLITSDHKKNNMALNTY